MKRSVIVGLVTFFSLLALTQYLAYQQYRIAKTEQSSAVSRELNRVSDRLEKLLGYSLSATNTLAFVVENYGVPVNFDSVAGHILRSHKYIDALELTRQGVITHVYPLAGNEAAIGLDVLNDSLASREAYAAIEKGELFFAGPLELRQGGMGVVGRLPIYVDREFFGFSVVIVRLPTFLQSIGISGQAGDSFTYQLSKVNPQTGREEFFLPESPAGKHEAVASIAVPDGAWRLYVSAQRAAALPYDVLVFALMGLLFALAAGLYSYHRAAEPEKLKRLVDQRTAQLIAAERKCRMILARISDAFIAFDTGLHCTYVNKRAREIFGFKPSEIINRAMWEYNPAFESTPLFQALKDAMTSQRYVCVVFFFAEKERWLENHLYPSRDGLSLFIRDITEIKNASNKLEASERYFRGLIENSADAITLADEFGKITYQSPSTERVTGYSPEEMPSGNGIELVHPDDRAQALLALEKIRQSPGEVVQLKHRFRHKNGQYIWIEGSYTNLLHDADLKAIVHNFYDVTDRVKAEEAIIQEKYLSDSIINSLPGVFYLYNRRRKFIRWNLNFERVSGYSAAEIARMDPLDLFDNSEKELLHEKIESVFLHGEDEVEAQFLTKQKQKIPHYFNGKRVEFNGEEYLIGMGLNISERIHAEEMALHELKEKESALNRISDGVVALDTDWRYHFLNDAALATHPMGREGALGKPILEVHPELEGTAFWKMYQDAMQTQQVMETESYYETMDKWFSAKAYPSANGLTIFYRDISGRKMVEQETVRLIDSLQAKNKDLQEFSHFVSHNLRAPLANILGLSSLMGRNAADDELYIKMLQVEAERLDQVVNDINDVVAAGKSNPEQNELVSFAGVLREAELELEEQIATSGARISADFSEVAGINSVRSHIRNILYHLLSNAIKYRKEGETVLIQVQSSRAGGFVCLSVQDNGRGIDLEKHDGKLFGLYRRFHVQQPIPGRGIGLNMVKSRVEFLGGYVEVESQLNIGSVFRVYLPEQYTNINKD